MSVSLQTTFANRDELIAYVREQFPEAATRDPHVSATRGGRKAAEVRLKQIDPRRYASSRNYLNGAVTRLSPYLRHGVLSLAEVRDYALQVVRSAPDAAKLVNELGWRDYWQRVYVALGDGIWSDREAYKTGFAARSYAPDMPNDIAEGTTGLACIDGFSRELRETGYLHNHVRMWLAAYLVHWRRVRWQAGARWFLEHLLDGDPASNNLSWQWVASTFAHKPYFFNRENLERYTDGVFCRTCPLAKQGCPFAASYEQLEGELFPRMTSGSNNQLPTPTIKGEPRRPSPPAGSGATVVWVHGDNLNPRGSAHHAHPHVPAIWVFDDALLSEWRIGLKRLVFLYECLIEIPNIVIRRGDIAHEVLAFAREQNATQLATAESPSPRFAKISAQLQRDLPLTIYANPAFVDDTRTLDLSRFSRYWRSVEGKAMKSIAGSR